MTNIDIFSGFLGAGKTTLIKKLIKESFAGQKVVLIENEFGEIGIDGGFLKESAALWWAISVPLCSRWWSSTTPTASLLSPPVWAS